MRPGRDGIVPLAMKFVRRDIDHRHLGVGYLDAGRVEIRIDAAFHIETGARGRAGDQLHDGLITDQRLAPPVPRDEREQPVFDLVPFAGAWWQMANRHCQTQFIGEILQFALP